VALRDECDGPCPSTAPDSKETWVNALFFSTFFGGNETKRTTCVDSVQSTLEIVVPGPMPSYAGLTQSVFDTLCASQNECRDLSEADVESANAVRRALRQLRRQRRLYGRRVLKCAARRAVVVAARPREREIRENSAEAQALQRQHVLQARAVELGIRATSEPREAPRRKARPAHEHQVSAPRRLRLATERNRTWTDGVRGRFGLREFMSQHALNLPGSRVR
jgi:hypothetical protein